MGYGAPSQADHRLHARGQRADDGHADPLPLAYSDADGHAPRRANGYRHEHAHDRRKAVDIANKYLDHYAGPDASDEVRSKIWNGGPRGHLKSSTIPYWEKVKAALNPSPTIRSAMRR